MSSKNARTKASKRKKASRPNGPARSASVSLLSAPAAFSINGVRRGLFFGNCNVKGQTGCRISGIVPFCTLGAANTTGRGLMDRGGNRLANWILRAADGTTLCPQLSRQVSCFSRYRLTKLRFIYDPIGSTASAVRLAFAYSNDPLSPAFYSALGFDYTAYNSLLTIPGSRAFSPWMGWSQNVAVDDNWKYVDNSASDTIAAANVRQEAYGVIMCLADSNPGTDYTYGILSIDFSIDLLDPCPLPTVPTTNLALHSSLEEESKHTDNPATSNVPDPGVAGVSRPQTVSDTLSMGSFSRVSNSSAPVAIPVRRQ